MYLLFVIFHKCVLIPFQLTSTYFGTRFDFLVLFLIMLYSVNDHSWRVDNGLRVFNFNFIVRKFWNHNTKYKQTLLLRWIQHFKSGEINSMAHSRVPGDKPSSVILCQIKYDRKFRWIAKTLAEIAWSQITIILRYLPKMTPYEKTRKYRCSARLVRMQDSTHRIPPVRTHYRDEKYFSPSVTVSVTENGENTVETIARTGCLQTRSTVGKKSTSALAWVMVTGNRERTLVGIIVW